MTAAAVIRSSAGQQHFEYILGAAMQLVWLVSTISECCLSTFS